eukprot:TRINITY_DN2622_c0_g1_i4.p1 TRINITY_DN2622_c0_g1~~TRINITY_DN2622_c0_g1_i4.p1  ORF type:complete len:129 (+),score=30.82 TRINITY_DN2622_c0_g1_i4:3-389(+)
MDKSWQEYLNSLVGTGNAIRSAAIFSLECDLLAFSPELNLSKEEMNKIVSAFSDVTGLRNDGCYLVGEKYLVLLGEESRISLKKGSGGAAIAKTNANVIVAVYGDTQHTAKCTHSVEMMAAYFRQTGR